MKPNRRGASYRRRGTSQRSKPSSSGGANSQKSKKVKHTVKAKVKRILRGRKAVPTYAIPKAKLEEAKQVLDSGIYKCYSTVYEDGCHTPPGLTINRLFGSKKQSTRQLLAECRDCLLNRDWTNLAALLSFPKKEFAVYFLKYAAICLLYCEEHASLDKFLHGVIGCVTDHDKEEFLKSLTSFCEEEMEAAFRQTEE